MTRTDPIPARDEAVAPLSDWARAVLRVQEALKPMLCLPPSLTVRDVAEAAVTAAFDDPRRGLPTKTVLSP